MPLVAAAVCPHPPLLIPEVAAGAAAELDELRSACVTAITRLCASDVRAVIVVGAGEAPEPAEPAVATFVPFGVALEIPVNHAGAVSARQRSLPLSLAVATWLLRDVDLPVILRGVPADLAPDQCLAIGRNLPGDQGWPVDQPWALLVMGDGSACRGQKSPGYDDPRAESFDATAAAALGCADIGALRAIDPTVAAELWCAGRAPWQVLAGAAERQQSGWRGELLYDAAPYGVGYFVATWTARAADVTHRSADQV